MHGSCILIMRAIWRIKDNNEELYVEIKAFSKITITPILVPVQVLCCDGLSASPS